MEIRMETGIPGGSGDRTDTSAMECLIAPSIVTDGVARALLMYQRLVESGFDTAQALNGA
jgi:hypothetical protein